MNKPSSINKSLPKTLNVYVSDVLVGRLTWFEGDYHSFEIDPGYDWSQGDPILSLSLKLPDGSVDYSEINTRTQLPPFFSNLLPEGHLREYLAARAGVRPQREFALLHALKEDLPGALRLEAASELDRQKRRASSTQKTDKRTKDDALHFSLAGVQLKFSALLESNRLTIPAQGIGGSYIVKLPSLRYKNVPENEFAMMELARRVGIDTAEVELKKTTSIKRLPEDIPENFGQSLVIKRFDRNGGKRIHTEDFAQIFKIYPRDKYKKVSYGGIANVLYREGGTEQLVEFIRRLTFSLLIGNADMHLKNWSVIYNSPQSPTLTPAYDMVSTILYLPDFNMGLSVGGEKHMHKIDESHFRSMAAKMLLPEKLVVDTMKNLKERFLAEWKKSKSDLPMSAELRSAIKEHLKSVRI